MKERQNKLLRFLLTNPDFVKIDEIAEAFSIGKRTVSRDLDVLEKWLSLRGVHLERKTHQGIRVLTFNNDTERILNYINSEETVMPEMDQTDRQKFIILYLLFHNREIKISEAANTFFVSDSCIWNDLNTIEILLKEKGIILIRQKGVGIRIEGEESTVRLFFLKVFSELFSHKTLINYIYSEDRDNTGSISALKLNLFIRHFRITADRNDIFSIVREAEKTIGCRFTISGEAFLYFYLITAGQRIRNRALITTRQKSFPDPLYKNTAEKILKILTAEMISGEVPDTESEMLGLILQSLEIGENISLPQESVNKLIPDKIHSFTAKLLAELENTANDLYYLDSDFETVISLSAASMSLRLENSIPHWHDDWGENLTDDKDSRIIKETILRMLYSELGLKADCSDIQHLLFHFKAASIKSSSYRKNKIRCIIFCFEGIGLASYLYSIIKRDFREIDVIESTAVYKFDRKYLENNNIDLIISTFNISNVPIPVIQIPLPLQREKLEKNIFNAVAEIKKTKHQTRMQKQEDAEEKESYLHIDTLLAFIQDFMIFEMPKPADIDKTVKIISQNLNGKIKSAKAVEKAFLKREELGPLFLEEYNIRMLHCKSSSVIRPCGGIIRYKKNTENREKCIIFMTAPDPCPEDIRKMLSEITLSAIENSKFRESLLNDDMAGIRKKLLSIYSSLL